MGPRIRSDAFKASMDYLKPAEVVNAMIEAGARKGPLSVSDLLIRGALAVAMLGIATTLAITAAAAAPSCAALALSFA